jgi:hypothetical protein
VLLSAALLVAKTAHAHAADEIIVTLTEQPDGTFIERITMTAQTLALLAPVDLDSDSELTQTELDEGAKALIAGVWEQAKLSPCARSSERAWLEISYVALSARFSCGDGELSQEFRWLMVLPATYRVVMGEQVARSDARTLHVPRVVATVRSVGPLDAGAAIIVACAALAGLTVKRGRWPAAAVGLFTLGFWLVHRLMT